MGSMQLCPQLHFCAEYRIGWNLLARFCCDSELHWITLKSLLLFYLRLGCTFAAVLFHFALSDLTALLPATGGYGGSRVRKQNSGINTV